jgi:hypothetical protein
MRVSVGLSVKLHQVYDVARPAIPVANVQRGRKNIPTRRDNSVDTLEGSGSLIDCSNEKVDDAHVCVSVNRRGRGTKSAFEVDMQKTTVARIRTGKSLSEVTDSCCDRMRIFPNVVFDAVLLNLHLTALTDIIRCRRTM